MADPILYRDYKNNAPDFGRGSFRRLKRAGAFDQGSALAQFNPFLPENKGQIGPSAMDRFSGPGGKKLTLKNLGPAISDYYAQGQAGHDEATARMRSVYDASASAAYGNLENARKGLNPIISQEMLATLQAQGRERVAREGAGNMNSAAARLAASGQSVNRANAAFAASQGQTAYQAGQSDINQYVQAEQTNHDGLIQGLQAMEAAGKDISGLLAQLEGVEGFAQSWAKARMDALSAIATAKAANQKE